MVQFTGVREPRSAADRPARSLLVVLLCGALSPLPAPADDAFTSQYVGFIDDVVARWPVAGPAPFSGDDELALTCIDTPGEERYVGARQEVLIHASLAAVAVTLDDIAHYRELYPDIVEVRVLERDRDSTRYVTAWERRVPLFFIPNTRFKLVHEVDRSRPDRLVYRYRLLDSRRLKHSDGVAVLEAVGPEATRLVEYDFFDAHWGPLSVGRVWRESLRGLFLADMSVKVRSENPTWSYQQVRTEVERLWSLDERRVERCRGSSQVALLP